MTPQKNYLLRKCVIFVTFSCLFTSSLFASENKTKLETKSSTSTTATTSKPSSGFVLYGNWCGPNHPPDITNAPAPIDLLDMQCKKHDLCYFEKNDFDCGCDREMVKEIDWNQKMKRFTPEQYLIAQNIKIHFAISPCNGNVEGNKILPTRILTRVYNKTKNHVLNSYDRFIGNRFPELKRSDDSSKTKNKSHDSKGSAEIEE